MVSTLTNVRTPLDLAADRLAADPKYRTAFRTRLVNNLHTNFRDGRTVPDAPVVVAGSRPLPTFHDLTDSQKRGLRDLAADAVAAIVAVRQSGDPLAADAVAPRLHALWLHRAADSVPAAAARPWAGLSPQERALRVFVADLALGVLGRMPRAGRH